MTKVLLVDDHQIVKDALRDRLAQVDSIFVVGEAGNGVEAIQFMKSHDVDIIIMDINMPKMNGIDATRKLMNWEGDTQIIMLTMQSDGETVKKALGAGARGFVTKNMGTASVVEAISVVEDGGIYVSPDALKSLVEDLRNDDLSRSVYTFLFNDKTPEETFTEDELAILDLICQENTTQEIADKLQVSKRTIESRRVSMMQKVNVKNSVGLVMFAARTGYFDRAYKRSATRSV